MPVKIQNIIKEMESIAPSALALSWDNVGLLVGSGDWETQKILIALDATDAVISEAMEKKCNLIITHHPLIFKPLKKITAETSLGLKIITLIENKTALYSAHTNLDLASGGVDDEFAKRVGITTPYNLPSIDASQPVGKFGPLIRQLTFDEFIETLKHNLEIDFVTVAGKAVGSVTTVATVCGSGMSYAKHAALSGADVFVTGDLKYHDGQLAEELGITIIDVTHFKAEKFILPILQKKLQAVFTGIEILCSENNSELFNVYR